MDNSFTTKKYGTIIHVNQPNKGKTNREKKESNPKLGSMFLNVSKKDCNKGFIEIPFCDSVSYLVSISNKNSSERRSFIIKFDEDVKYATALFHAKDFLEKINNEKTVNCLPYEYDFDLNDGWEIDNVNKIAPNICTFELWNPGYKKELQEAEKNFFNKFGEKVPESFYNNDRYEVIDIIESCISRGVVEYE